MFWTDEMINNRNRVIAIEEAIKELPEKVPGRYINFGCGGKPYKGFMNVDKYAQGEDVVNFDMYKVPSIENDSTIGIYSSHSLEHLPIRHAKYALREWYRILKKGGKLYLAIPDLEMIMHILTTYHLDDYTFDWFVYTLFGYQVNPKYREGDLDLPVEYGQFHTCGFTKKTITRELSGIGYKVNDVFNFDGWNTPSIWIEAEK